MLAQSTPGETQEMKSPRIAIAALALSALGFSGIALHEGYSSSAIRPVPGDVPTYGLGSTTKSNGQPVQMGDTITPPAAIVLAVRDVSAKESVLKGCITAPLHQYEYDALVSLAYNVGPAAVCRSSIPAKLAAGDYAAACKTILDFDGFRDCSKPMVKNPKTGKWECPLVRLGGLTKRRQQEYRMCLGDAQ